MRDLVKVAKHKTEIILKRWRHVRMRKEERLGKSSKAEDRDNTQEIETCEDEERRET